MLTVGDGVYLPINLVSLLASGSGTLFIFVVNALDLIFTKKLNLTDQLIFGISIIQISFVIHNIYRCITIIFMRVVVSDVHGRIQFVSYMMLMSSNLWFCTWLCLHFCLKIVKFNNRFDIFLRRRFFKMFPWLYCPSVMGSLLVSIPFAWYETNNEHNTTQQMNITLFGTVKNESLNFTTNGKQFNVFLPYLIVITLGFILCLASVGSIIFSLYKHMKRMRLNNEGSRMPTMKAHVHAAKTVASLLFLNILLFTALFLIVFKGNELLCQIFNVLTLFFHLVCSFNLIKGNTKLDKAFRKLLAKCPFHRTSDIQASA